MGVKLKNWDRAGKMFEFTIPEVLDQSIENAVNQAEKLYSESILNVITEQPGDWAEKSESWTKASGSSDLFIGKTWNFVSAVATPGANSRGIRAKRNDRRIFVGARHDIMHHSGFSMEQLANILQATPDGSRDLFGRAYERVEGQLNHIFRQVGTELR